MSKTAPNVTALESQMYEAIRGLLSREDCAEAAAKVANAYADQRVSEALNEAIILIKNETNMTVAESIAKYRIIPKLAALTLSTT